MSTLAERGGDVSAEERDLDELGGAFRFRAGIESELDWVDGAEVSDVFYAVRLPHQCDAWVITKSRSREAAVKSMELFIAEAQDALEKLRKAT